MRSYDFTDSPSMSPPNGQRVRVSRVRMPHPFGIHRATTRTRGVLHHDWRPMATVLVVDDDPISRDFLRTLLGYRGHRACEAADGDTALLLARQRLPDAVITD